MTKEELKTLDYLAAEVDNETLTAIMNVRIHEVLYGRMYMWQRLFLIMSMIGVVFTAMAASTFTFFITCLTFTVVTGGLAGSFRDKRDVHARLRRDWIMLQHKLIQFKWRVQRLPVDDVEQLHTQFVPLIKERADIAVQEPVLLDSKLIERCQIAAEIQTGRRPPAAKYEELSLYDKYISACDKRHKNM